MAITTVGLDADDTLWHSENHFVVTEERFRALLEPWLDASETAERLLARERHNLAVFGYGIKGFTLSMIETAIEASGATIDAASIGRIVDWGKEMLEHPVELLPGVAETVDALRSDYRLVLVTKGDLFHQESKIAESGLAEYFDAVEILSEKSCEHYARVLHRNRIEPSEFCMVGNSARSDVLPVLELGGRGVHVPYHVTWAHEEVDGDSYDLGYPVLGSITELPSTLRGFS
jgi:putative hydrolase of the HAD superfamily